MNTLLAMGLGMASANEAPNELPEEEPVPEIRHVNSGFAFGVAYLAAMTPASKQRYGLDIGLRKEVPLSRAFQFDFTLAMGLTTPENTAAMAAWGTNAGRSITDGFGDVTAWVRDGRGPGGAHELRRLGAIFAYTGLGFSYLVVPVAWVLSPFASIGHTIVGPTVSFHTSPRSPDGYVEVGVGGMLYGDPVNGGPAVGYGPMVGAGAHVGKQTVGLRVLASPPGMHAADGTDTIVTGAFVVGL